MSTRKLLQESGTLRKGASDGTYRVCIITEGTGSTGVYTREMLIREGDAFTGALSFMGHPADPSRPQDRALESIAGRLEGPVAAEEHDGVLGLWSDFRPNTSDPKRAAFIAEYADALGVSVFIGADGVENDQGLLVVESLDAADPYKSVDIVIAAGRGGRFARAAESLRVLESHNPPAEASAGTTKEGNMDEVLKALASLTSLMTDFVTESKTAATAKVAAEATATDVETAVEKAVTEYDAKVVAIDAAELFPSQVESLRSIAAQGGDVTKLIESAKKVVVEAGERLGSKIVTGGHVLEGANDDFTVSAWGVAA